MDYLSDYLWIIYGLFKIIFLNNHHFYEFQGVNFMTRKRENKLKAVMFEQQIKLLVPVFGQSFEQYYNSAPDDEKKNIILEQLKNHFMLLNGQNTQIDQFHAIVHDKDIKEDWIDVVSGKVTTLKEPHVHAVIIFKGEGYTITDLVTMLPYFEAERFEKPKKGRYAVDNMLAYLMHAKETTKHVYDPSEVFSVYPSNEPEKSYLEIYKARKTSWDKGRVMKFKKEASVDANYLIDKIEDGKLSKNQILRFEPFYKLYCKYTTQFKNAFSCYGERKSLLAVDALEAGEFRKKVIFVYGDGGRGKSRYAREILKQIGLAHYYATGENWSIYKGANNNPLDDYEGEELILLDDARGDTMTSNDWLNLLDPENASPASARFHNKQNVAPRFIVITTAVNPFDFFKETKNGDTRNEDEWQFLRRLSLVIGCNKYFTKTFYKIAKKNVITEFVNFDDVICSNSEYRFDYVDALSSVDISNTEEIGKYLLNEDDWTYMLELDEFIDEVPEEIRNKEKEGRLILPPEYSLE